VLALSRDLQDTVKYWEESVVYLNTRLFKGVDEGLEYFWSIIRDGKWVKQGMAPEALNSEWGQDPTERRKWAERVLYSMVIPLAWRRGGRNAFVLDTGKDCESVGYLNGKMMSSDTDKEARVCVDKMLYYLVAPDVSTANLISGGEGCSEG